MDAQNNLRISRVLHAGYLFESQNTRILFDPIFENPFSFNCYAYPNVSFDFAAVRQLQLSAIFISHYHDDHCSLESLQHLDKATPVYLYCVHEELFTLLREFGFKDVRALRVDRTEVVGPFMITPRRALDEHTDTLFEVIANDCKILNVVDAQIGDETLEQLASNASWDLVLWPFQVMRESEVLAPTRVGHEIVNIEKKSSEDKTQASALFPAEWTQQLQSLQPRAVVPSSCQLIHEEWSWYRNFFFSYSYSNFQKFIAQILPATKVLRLNPGCSLQWTHKQFHQAEPLSWIRPMGPQDVDYLFRPQEIILETSVIAQKFPALSPQQQKCVDEFCESEILKRYHHIGPPEDIYFQKNRLWRLSIFDHTGTPSHYFYNLCDEHMTPANKPYVTETLAWTTEIAAYKLYSALEAGESLSSLYLRINPETLSPKIEEELREVNHLDDPLLRVLYNGDALGYQRSQLRRLLL